MKVLLRSKDVLHNFTVPQFRVKMDLVPGMVTYFWLTPTRTGRFDALCEELCGVAHFAMRGRVVVDEEPAYQAWLAAQPTFAQTAARVKGDRASRRRRCSRPARRVMASKARATRSSTRRSSPARTAGT